MIDTKPETYQHMTGLNILKFAFKRNENDFFCGNKFKAKKSVAWFYVICLAKFRIQILSVGFLFVVLNKNRLGSIFLK